MAKNKLPNNKTAKEKKVGELIQAISEVSDSYLIITDGNVAAHGMPIELAKQIIAATMTDNMMRDVICSVADYIKTPEYGLIRSMFLKEVEKEKENVN